MSHVHKEKFEELLTGSKKGNIKARQRLVTLNLPLVQALASRYSFGRIDAEDIFQEGCVGLIKALDKFDPDRGTSFSTYAVPFILGEIRSFLRDNGYSVKVSRSYHKHRGQFQREKERLEQSLKRHPTLEELARAMNLSREEVTLLVDETVPQKLSFEEIMNKTEIIGITGAPNAEDWFFTLRFMEALSKLPFREKQVMVLRYVMDKSQVKTAKKLKLSQSYVSRLEQQALQKLKQNDW